MRERLLGAIAPLFGAGLFGLALWILHRELSTTRLEDVLAHLHAIPRARVAWAIALTVVGYLVLTGYDLLAFRYIGNALARGKVVFASFIGFVFSHNVGLSFFGGSAVRYRILSSFGVSPGDIARVITFNLFTFWLGFLSLGGAVLILAPISVPRSLHVVFTTSRPIGVALLATFAGCLVASAWRREPIRLGGFEFALPRPEMTLAQTLLSAVDWALAASVLYVLLPHAHHLTSGRFLGIFLLAQVIGLASHVPGGLGVFESVMVLLLAPYLSGDVALGSVLAYRVVYYLAPLAVGIAALAGYELRERRHHFARAQDLVALWFPALVPPVIAVGTFAGGVILLVSGATPAAPGRMEGLARLIPLPVMEVSHLLGSAIGVGLLLLARALQQRVDAAYLLSLALLATGSLVSLLKGFDYEEASYLALLFLALLPCRGYFHRRSSLLSQAFSFEWIIGIAGVVIGTGMLVLLAYRDVAYAHELWWRFDLSSHASRSLRALLAASVVLAAYALARLLRPAAPIVVAPSEEDVKRALPVIDASTRASSHLALLGDKQLMFSDDGKAFLMYGVARGSWISMGDPVGPAEQRRELAWRFREMADQHGGRAVFYEVTDEDLPVYLELGLSLRKLGEEARVPLEDFTLEGSQRRGQRQTVSRMVRDGCSFELVRAEGVPAILDELAAISDAWLAEKNTREKRFSLGRFDPDYLRLLPIGVVRRNADIVAFANVWPCRGREELSIDLMRHRPDAPAGSMEYLFTELMLWGHNQGYRWFSLGMAPLSGFEHHRLAPLWNRLGALLFRYGENFYNFRGLRAFKDKFHPVWEPRFLASPGGLSVPLVLTHVASLVSGGVSGVVTK
jgi:phosphatidylglycerol lysyltransferase